MKIIRITFTAACLVAFMVGLAPALCWSNGGYSADPTNPDYGTHDWIAQHALDYLPTQEKQYITDNLAVYLLGTELPDNSNKTIGGIGDTTKHHVYYSSAGTLVDAASALRANESFNQALTYLKNGDYTGAAKTAGTLTHYIADVAVFGHVMGASTDWGAEVHHSDYETHVNDKTGSYQSTFNSYLSYDGSLTTVSAYDATVNLAYNTVFGGSSQKGCVWMDTHYNWGDPAFSGRCEESLNLAVNAVADVLHTLYAESSPSPTASPTPAPTPSATASPSTTPTTTPTTTPSAIGTPEPAATPTPTVQPSNAATPSTHPTPTPTAPEFPTAILLAAMLTLTATAIVIKKNRKTRP